MHARIPPARQRGAVLLEVILALVLFATAATIIGVGLNASIESVERLRLSTHAADLAVSAFSELQAGIRSPGEEGAQPAGPGFEQWTCEITAVAWDGNETESESLRRVEVVLRHESGFVHRATQVLKLQAKQASTFAGNDPFGRAWP